MTPKPYLMITHYLARELSFVLLRFALLLFVLMLAGNSHADNTDKLKVGITSPLNKVFQSIPFNFQGRFIHQAEIELALNEYESTQIVLFPETDFNGIKINISTLIHENKIDTINSDFIQLHPIGYVNLQGRRKNQVRLGFHPDILLPNQRFDMHADVPQPVLVNVYAPPNSKPGRYYSELTINDTRGLNITVKLNVLVHPVEIPKKPQFKSLSLARNYNYSRLWPTNQGFRQLNHHQEKEIYKKLARLGFRNRLPPTAFLVNGLVSYNHKDKGETFVSFPTHDRKTGLFTGKKVDEYINYVLENGANSFFIGVTSDIYKYEKNSQERETVLLNYLDDLIPHLKKRGVLEHSYLYNIDEPWGDAVKHAKKIYRLVKKRYGNNITVMQNTNQNNDRILHEFLDHFDTIDINLGFYNITKLQRYRDKYPRLFQDVWWNLNLWPRSRPNLFLEYPLIDARIIGPMSFRFNIQGFEYWDLAYMHKIKKYRPVKANDFKLDWVVKKHSLDGLLLYPNEDYDFYSSMRFESFRDGMEDLELLYLLQRLDPDNALLDVSIVNDIDDYSESTEQYMDFRRALFAEINRLQ